jgi:hypothetical protein
MVMFRRLLIVILFPLLAVPVLAQPVPDAKNQGVTINSATSTQVLPRDDLSLGLRDYLLIQCTGGNTCYCCIGTNNACTTLNGTELAAGTGSWILTSVPRTNGIIIPAPAGDVSCTSSLAGTSNVVTLDY